MSDKKDLVTRKSSSVLEFVKAMNPLKSRVFKKRAENETALLTSLTKLGEAGESLKRQQNRIANIDVILDGDTDEIWADRLEKENKLAEQQRKATQREREDSRSLTQAEIDLEKANQELERLKNPIKPRPKIKPSPVDGLKKKRVDISKIDHFVKQELSKIDKLEQKGTLTNEEANLERDNIRDQAKQAKQGL